jgi:uncharacterized protein (DUF4415 family)
MARKRDTVHATSEDIVAMLARGDDETDWVRVNAKTEKDLAADTTSDPAWAGIDDDWVKSAEVANGLLERPKENKRQVTMRFDADVLDFFKTGGRGWQGRMNAVLRSFMERRHG